MQQWNTHPTVELLIPVYKPGKELAALLEKMAQQTYPLQSIHLLVTAEEGEFEKICTMHQRGNGVRFTRIDPAEFDHGGTRHLGATQSSADILMFMTQDAVPENEHLVNELVKAMGLSDQTDACETEKACNGEASWSKVAAVYARQLPADDCNILERYTRRFNYPEESCVKTAQDLPRLGIKTYFCSNVCAAYRRDVYEKLGGFERHTIFNEDMIFAAGLIRTGYAVAYAADARVIHSHNYSGMQQLHRNFDLAVSQAEHPEVFEGVPSEGEGIRMVKSTAGWLCRNGKVYLLPKLIWQSGCKYLGYLLGRRYRKLPKKLVLWLTMNKRYWKE